MKNTLVVVLLFINVLAFGQNFNSLNDSVFQKADTIFSTPYIDGLSFLKVRTEKKESIFLSITLYATTIIEGQKGASILLDNGRSINKLNVAIKAQPVLTNHHYLYSSLLELTENDVLLLSTYQVTRFRLYLYYNDVKQGQKLKEEFLELLRR